MFWGLMLEPGKRYSQTVDDSFHVSMASLEVGSDDKGTIPSTSVVTRIMVQHDKSEFLICSLVSGVIYQQSLDLNFTEGEEVTLYVEGPGTVHLTGYLVKEEPFDMEDALEGITGTEDEESDEEENEDDTQEEELDLPSLQALVKGLVEISSEDEEDAEWQPAKAAKRKRASDENVKEISKQKKKPKKENRKSLKTSKEQNQEDENDEAEDAVKDEDDDDDDDDEDDKEDENLDSEMQDLLDDIGVNALEGKRQDGSGDMKMGGKENAAPSQDKESTNAEVGSSGDSKKRKKKKKKKAGQVVRSEEDKGSQAETDQKEKQKVISDQEQIQKKKKLSTGVIVQDLKLGEGKIAKDGRMVGVFYKGVLAKSKKQFDACLTGKPFTFRLGKKEVITGWDDGVKGMKVGGRRKLIIPASQGYGSRKMGPIPPNSTLIFEVQLESVK